MAQPGWIPAEPLESSVSSAWASMPLARAAFIAEVMMPLPITWASRGPPCCSTKRIANIPGFSTEPETMAAIVSNIWCFAFWITSGGNSAVLACDMYWVSRPMTLPSMAMLILLLAPSEPSFHTIRSNEGMLRRSRRRSQDCIARRRSCTTKHRVSRGATY